jgi:hypothetical protein
VHCDYSTFLRRTQVVHWFSWKGDKFFPPQPMAGRYPLQEKKIMNVKNLIAAAALFTAASAVFAADAAPAATATTAAATATAAAVAAPAASAATVSAAAQVLNLPSVTIAASRSRDEVRAEAVDFVAHHKTMLQTQLEWSNN